MMMRQWPSNLDLFICRHSFVLGAEPLFKRCGRGKSQVHFRTRGIGIGISHVASLWVNLFNPYLATHEPADKLEDRHKLDPGTTPDIVDMSWPSVVCSCHGRRHGVGHKGEVARLSAVAELPHGLPAGARPQEPGKPHVWSLTGPIDGKKPKGDRWRTP